MSKFCKICVSEALKKSNISTKKWDKIKLIALQNNNGMGEFGHAYVGGMKDFLWAMSKADHTIYDPLEKDMIDYINKYKDDTTKA